MYVKSSYEVDYPDGTTYKLKATIIAQNMISQVDFGGHYYQVQTEITGHNRDNDTIRKVNGFIKFSNGNLHKKCMTHGWKLLVEQKDRSVDCVPIKELNQYKIV